MSADQNQTSSNGVVVATRVVESKTKMVATPAATAHVVNEGTQTKLRVKTHKPTPSERAKLAVKQTRADHHEHHMSLMEVCSMTPATVAAQIAQPVQAASPETATPPKPAPVPAKADRCDFKHSITQHTDPTDPAYLISMLTFEREAHARRVDELTAQILELEQLHAATAAPAPPAVDIHVALTVNQPSPTKANEKKDARRRDVKLSAAQISALNVAAAAAESTASGVSVTPANTVRGTSSRQLTLLTADTVAPMLGATNM